MKKLGTLIACSAALAVTGHAQSILYFGWSISATNPIYQSITTTVSGPFPTITSTLRADALNNTAAAPENSVIRHTFDIGIQAGSVPMAIKNISLHYDGKVVAAGGLLDGSDLIFTDLGLHLDYFLDFKQIGTETAEQISFEGNGLRYFNGSYNSNVDYIVPSGEVLLIRFRGVASMVVKDPVNNLPYELAYEAGDDLSADAFDGIKLQFDAVPVPEPATMTALGLGTLALLRRKKKQA